MVLSPAARRREELKQLLKGGVISRRDYLSSIKEERLTLQDLEKARQAAVETGTIDRFYIKESADKELVRSQLNEQITGVREQQKQEYIKAETSNILSQQKESAMASNRQRLVLEQPQQPTRTAVRQLSKETITPQQERRVEQLVERETRLRDFTTLNGTLAASEDVSPWNLKEIAKMIARKPLEIGAAPSFIGGRIALAADLTTSKAGRDELKRAALITPIAVASSFDIRKPEGILNLGLAGLSIKGFASARITARQDIKYGLEGFATRRSGTVKEFRDVTKGRIEAVLGNKKLIGKVQGTEEFFKQNQKTYISGGQTEIRYSTGKQALFDTRSITKINAKGSSTAQIARVTNGGIKGENFYITKTKTALLEKNPLTTQRTISTTRAAAVQTPINSGKPSSVSTGISQEIIRQNLVTESGQVIQTSLFKTGRLSVGANIFNKNFGIDIVKQAKGNLPSSTGQATTLKTASVSQISTQGATQAALAQVKTIASNIKAAQISTGLLKGSTSVFAVNTMQVQERSLIPQARQQQIPQTESVTNLIQKPTQQQIPQARQQQIPQLRQIPQANIRPMFSVIPLTNLRSITAQQLSIRPQQSTALKTIQLPSIFPVSPVTPPGGMNTPRGFLPFFNLKIDTTPSLVGRKSDRGLPGYTQYKPSLEALFFNVRGVAPKVITPFTLRPIAR